MRFKKTIAAILPMIISSGMVTNLLGSSLLTINAEEPAVKTEEIAVCGDIDGNGIVDAIDASAVLSYYAFYAMKLMWEIMLQKLGGYFEFIMKPDGFVKEFVLVTTAYLVITIFDFIRIRRIPKVLALKNAE